MFSPDNTLSQQRSRNCLPEFGHKIFMTQCRSSHVGLRVVKCGEGMRHRNRQIQKASATGTKCRRQKRLLSFFCGLELLTFHSRLLAPSFSGTSVVLFLNLCCFSACRARGENQTVFVPHCSSFVLYSCARLLEFVFCMSPFTIRLCIEIHSETWSMTYSELTFGCSSMPGVHATDACSNTTASRRTWMSTAGRDDKYAGVL